MSNNTLEACHSQNNHPLDSSGISPFLWLYIRKKILLKIKSAKIKWFKKNSIARIWPFKFIFQISIMWYVAKRIEDFFLNYLYLACSQIWLNLPMDHRHVGYITKLTPQASQKTTVGDYTTRHVPKKRISCTRVFMSSWLLHVLRRLRMQRGSRGYSVGA